jgi:Ca2+-binding RTX toxin-like protein
MSDDPFYTGTRLTVVTISQALPSTLIGGAGNDTLIGGNGNDSLSGGAGHDAVAGAIGDDIIDGDGNADTLNAGAGKDVLRGGNGDDRIVSDADDTLFGGNGFDCFSPDDPRASYDPGGELPIIDMEGIATPNGAPDARIEGDTLIVLGTRRSDRISVTGVFYSVAALDVHVNDHSFKLLGQTHIQKIRIEGGNGDDEIQIGPETRPPNIFFIPEFVPVQQDLELIGGNGNDTLIAGDGADTLLGGPGNDELAGGDNDDYLDGGRGADTLRGNAGTNHLINGEVSAFPSPININ